MHAHILYFLYVCEPAGAILLGVHKLALHLENDAATSLSGGRELCPILTLTVVLLGGVGFTSVPPTALARSISMQNDKNEMDKTIYKP